MPVTSRMSSTIWKRTPSSSAKRRYGNCRRSRPAPRQDRAADRDAAAISATRSSARASAPERPRPAWRRSTSRYWPPTMPPTPVAPDELARAAASTRSGVALLALGRAAGAPRRTGPSPARIATSSPKATCSVGRPAPQLVVVHRGQVVVDQRVGVDQLDRGRGRQHLTAGRGRAPRPWRARAPGGSACRRRAASSASPPRGRRCPGRPRSAARPGTPSASSARYVGVRHRQSRRSWPSSWLAARVDVASRSAPTRSAARAQRWTSSRRRGSSSRSRSRSAISSARRRARRARGIRHAGRHALAVHGRRGCR